MALAPLTAATANPALQGLIESLAPNTPPAPPSAWPPAPIVWIVAAFAVIALAAVAYWIWKTRVRRRYLSSLRALQRHTDGEYLQPLHRLLRNASAHQDPVNKSLSDADFARLIAENLQQTNPPEWVNAHYRPGPTPDVDWRQARRLVRRWCA